MKNLILTSMLAALVALGTTVKAQDFPDEYLGLPGDNLNLYAVMKLFQESETLESFERNLNDENSRINNLDLNGDNLIDYITVTDFPKGDDHTIVMRVPLGRKDFQDIAVFTVQRFSNGSVQIQLIGDEALYGKNYIIEPIYEETPNPGYMGRTDNRTYVNAVRTTPYEIAAWPLIRFIYMPDYFGWHSSWYWGYYPEWWNPWHPYYWDYYYGYHYNWYNDYYSHYHHWGYCRWDGYNDFYYHGMRSHSSIVAININNNFYRNTYSHPEQRKDGEALYNRTHSDRESSRTMASRPKTGAGRQAPDSYREGVRQQATKSSSVQRPSASTRPSTSARSDASMRSGTSSRPATSASTRSEYKPATSDGRLAPDSYREGVRQQATKSSSVQRPAASSSPSASSRPTQSQRSPAVSSSRSSGSSQRSPAASSSRSSGQNHSSSAVRSSQPSRSSSSSSSRSSSKDSRSRR
ncbi:MAG: hypothetical protein NT092_08050 [Bacteroidia bacterium]|nr:hypothetical protein [Bacteroidia bacterium]